MKKLLLFALIITAFVSCKRKQTLRELDSNETIVKYPLQCYNAVQDPDETGVDCGGPCGSCNVATPTCTYVSKSVKIGLATYTTSGTSCGLVSSYYRFSGNYGNGSYQIELGTTAPDMSKAYNITNSVPGVNDATVNFSDFSYGSLNLLSGNVYISQVGGVYHATICGGTAYSFVTSQTYTITGDVACP